MDPNTAERGGQEACQPRMKAECSVRPTGRGPADGPCRRPRPAGTTPARQFALDRLLACPRWSDADGRKVKKPFRRITRPCFSKQIRAAYRETPARTGSEAEIGCSQNRGAAVFSQPAM